VSWAATVTVRWNQINTGNVDRLQMEWVYSLEAPNLEPRPSWWTA
jgi:hypothetical protein